MTRRGAAGRPALNLDFSSGDLVAGLKGPAMFYLPPGDIVVDQGFNPRGLHTPDEEAFGEAALRALGESLRRDGMLSPLLVHKDAQERYHLIAGERRLRAARLVELERVPVVLHAEQGRYRLALLENLQRENLNAADETLGVLRLLAEDTGLSEGELPAALRQAARKGAADPHGLAEKLHSYGGHSLDAWARHRLNLLRMTAPELAAVRAGQAPWRSVAELTRLPEGEGRGRLLARLLAEQLPLKAVSELVKQLLTREVVGQTGKASPVSAELRQLTRAVRPEAIAALPAAKRERAEALLRELGELLA